MLQLTIIPYDIYLDSSQRYRIDQRIRNGLARYLSEQSETVKASIEIFNSQLGYQVQFDMWHPEQGRIYLEEINQDLMQGIENIRKQVRYYLRLGS